MGVLVRSREVAVEKWVCVWGGRVLRVASCLCVSVWWYRKWQSFHSTC